MVKVTTIFGEDTIREYKENNELPSEGWLTDNGGVVDEKEFETETGYNAYIARVDDADGQNGCHIIRHRSEKADTSRKENLWLRFGISVRGSRKDIKGILSEDTEALRKLLDAGRYGIGGETYVPGSTVEECNEDHGTEFEKEDVEFHL